MTDDSLLRVASMSSDRLRRGRVAVGVTLSCVLAAVLGPAASSATSSTGPFGAHGRYTPAHVVVSQSGQVLTSWTYTPSPSTGNWANDVVTQQLKHGKRKILAGKVGDISRKAPNHATGPLPESFQYLNDVATDRMGNLYLAGSGVVGRVSSAGRFEIVAGSLKGNGMARLGKPEEGRATQSKLGGTLTVAADRDRNVYIADFDNDVVEKVSRSGHLSIYAGRVGRTSPPDPSKGAAGPLGMPSDVAVDGAGNVFVTSGGYSTNFDLPANNQIVEIDPSGDLTIVAGKKGYGRPTFQEPAVESRLGINPTIAVSPSGSVYIAIGSDSWKKSRFAMVAMVDANGDLERVAGAKKGTGKPRVGPAGKSHLTGPTSLSFTRSGALLFIDHGSVLRIDSKEHLSIVQREVKIN